MPPSRSARRSINCRSSTISRCGARASGWKCGERGAEDSRTRADRIEGRRSSEPLRMVRCKWAFFKSGEGLVEAQGLSPLGVKSSPA
ncbi:MAG: hypothetical protein DI536_12845 [Archangium gephyra]|uniref:Uncharacterized protein n=1 Tax=Archangium gephyra TaxID=48 RepID=A0A2W5TIT6_9BACT|nr:MAG: hypothetical protein DI536_12845 [Archangium gephyra]